MPFPDFSIRRILVIRYGDKPHVVAKSDNIDFELEEIAIRITSKFGKRPTGVFCPQAIFATPMTRSAVAVVQVADRPDRSDDPPLAFFFLIFSRDIYTTIGDPFEIADRLPAIFDIRGSLGIVNWHFPPAGPRKVEDLKEYLKNLDSPLLLGATQALLDGARILIQKTEPDPLLLRALWQLLPDRCRCDLWPATFALSPDLNFHIAVSPLCTVGFLTTEQVKDYPEGRYELSLQAAVESDDQAELTRLLNRPASTTVLKLALVMVIVAFVVAFVLKFL